MHQCCCFIFTGLFLLLSVGRIFCTRSQLFIKPESCNESEFFDAINLVCQKCGNGYRRSADGFFCECAQQYRKFASPSDIVVQCIACSSDQVVSEDGWNCMVCQPRTRFDNNTSRCVPCQRNSVAEEKWVGNVLTQACIPCRPPYWSDATGTRCVRCPRDFISSSGSDCKCAEKFSQIGGTCIPTKDLLPAESSLFTISYQNGQKIKSKYLQDHLQAAFYNCQVIGNETACQILANQCVLTLYRTNESPLEPTSCSEYLRVVSRAPRGSAASRIPWLYYLESKSFLELASNDVPVRFSIDRSWPGSFLNLTVIGYGSSGQLEEIRSFSSILTNVLCKMSSYEWQSLFSFGVNVKRKCTFGSQELWESSSRLMFYDLYLSGQENGQDVLYPIPVLIRNMVSRGQSVNAGEDLSRWQLVRRFFLTDSGMNDNRLRYLSSIFFQISVVDSNEDTDGTGRIHPPLLILQYSESAAEQYRSNALVQVEIGVEYVMAQEQTFRRISIALGVLGSLCVVRTLFSTWGWAKRAGREAVDFVVACRFAVLLCGALADVFVVVLVIASLNWIVLFKSQAAIHLLLPSTQQESVLSACLITAFIMKSIHLLVILAEQCTPDVFFIDWEQPHAGCKNLGVSLWRTYHVANNWSALQTMRRIPPHFHLAIFLSCVKVLGLERLAEPTEGRPFVLVSATALFGVCAATFLGLALLQVAVCRLFCERFFGDRLQQFVDLCSVCNISLFLMTGSRFGYYVHGRSPHGRADVDRKEMHQLLLKEEEDLCSRRGLLPDTEQQTFAMCLPSSIREQYARLLSPLTSYNRTVGRMQDRGVSGLRQPKVDIDHITRSYCSINKFLCGFIEHAYRDADYIVRDRLFLEKLLNVEFSYVQDKGFFYSVSGQSFDVVLLCGKEMTLLTFELLVLSLVVVFSRDVVLATLVTFFVSKTVDLIKKRASRRNLVEKAVIDERFLK